MQNYPQLDELLAQVITIGEAVADKVSLAVTRDGIENASRIHAHAASDIIYQVDQVAENAILEGIKACARDFDGITLVAEGIGESDVTVWPGKAGNKQTSWRLLIDPVDGTRGLMVDKRPAFFLAGIAPDNGELTHLSDICAAAMVEIPTTKMHLADTFSAIRNHGAVGVRRNLLTGKRDTRSPAPSRADRLHGGFAQLARFFSPGKDVLARLEEDLLEALYPDAAPGEIVAFEDQYISSGGQLYELLTGKDRFVADVRASLYRQYADKLRAGHVCHPYDLAAHLIGTEAGLILTGIDGNTLDGSFSTTCPMDWIGYANREIFNEVSPLLNSLLIKYNLL